MDVEICRVCLEAPEGMVNIFDDIPDKNISIAYMISQCTGFRVLKGDLYPETICSPCKQDATNAYEIKQVYEKSHRAFCQIVRDIRREEDLLVEQNCEITDSNGTAASKAHYKVINEGIEKYTTEKKNLERDQFHGQVKNEPIEEDIFEEDHLDISDCELDQFDSQIKIEEFEDHEDKAKSPLNKKQHPHKCSQCTKSFSEITDLKLHIRTHAEELPYKCSHCQKTFARKGGLKLHMRTHTGERPYKCSHCPKAFSLNCTLQKHIRTHTGEKPYKCSHCPKSFVHIGPLQLHIRTHTGERPYKCSQCQKSFSQNGHLRDHIRTHTGEKPYKCSQCQKSFSLNQTLQRHINAHTGDRPYKCSHKLCKKSFSRVDSLLDHVRTHTGERPFKCSHCEKDFSLKRYLQLHIRTHT